jgi:hypothetical protein
MANQRPPDRPAQQRLEVCRFTSEQAAWAIGLLEKRIADVMALDPTAVSYKDETVRSLEQRIRGTVLEIFGESSREYRHRLQRHRPQPRDLRDGPGPPRKEVRRWRTKPAHPPGRRFAQAAELLRFCTLPHCREAPEGPAGRRRGYRRVGALLHEDARAYYLYGVLDQVMKASMAGMRWLELLGEAPTGLPEGARTGKALDVPKAERDDHLSRIRAQVDPALASFLVSGVAYNGRRRRAGPPECPLVGSSWRRRCVDRPAARPRRELQVGYSTPSRSVHPNIAGPTGQSTEAEVEGNVDKVGLPAFHVIALAHDLTGIKPESASAHRCWRR